MKPRVVIYSAFLTPFRSGAEACAEEVALRLADQYDITIITARLRRDLPRKSQLAISKSQIVPVPRVGFGFGFDKWLYPFLAPLAARRIRPALLHAVLESFAGLALLFSQWILPRAKRLLTLQTTNRSFLKSSIIKSAHRVTAISDVLVHHAQECGVRAERIPNGIDLATFKEARKKHAKVPGRILFVGRLEKMKGVDTLLRAVSGQWSVVSSLHIVGSGSQCSALQQLTKNLGIANRVTFLGYISSHQIAREYAEAEIFCGLSRSEALGNVFLEAQAAGCVVVATNIGGIPEIVLDGKTGLLISPNDPEGAGVALQKLLDDPALRKNFSDAGRKNAEVYDWNLIAPRYATEYNRLLHGLS